MIRIVTSLLIASTLCLAVDWDTRPREIPDVAVVDQDGRPVKFYTDLVKGRTVAIQTIFTSCKTICPPLAATYHSVEKLLGPNSDVRLISVSIDPETDRPDQLKAFAEKFGAGPNWTLVTGERAEIEKLLVAFRAYTPDRTAHTAMVIIGNDASGYWTRSYGLAPAASIAKLLEQARSTQK